MRMATIIRASDDHAGSPLAMLNFDDLAAQADQLLIRARSEAAKLVAEAQGQADSIRQQADEAGRRAAREQIEAIAAARLNPALTAMQRTAAELQAAKQSWLSHWERGAVRLAVAIAGRIIRRELSRQPDISLALLREALELAAGSPTVRVCVNPEDYRALGTQMESVIATISAIGQPEVTADAAVSRGGCRVETRFGSIDQQVESQLKRIEEELTQ
jgi:flagellar assembly protein FliH